MRRQRSRTRSRSPSRSRSRSRDRGGDKDRSRSRSRSGTRSRSRSRSHSRSRSRSSSRGPSARYSVRPPKAQTFERVRGLASVGKRYKDMYMPRCAHNKLSGCALNSEVLEGDCKILRNACFSC